MKLSCSCELQVLGEELELLWQEKGTEKIEHYQPVLIIYALIQ
jgi:hypothetical protein